MTSGVVISSSDRNFCSLLLMFDDAFRILRARSFNPLTLSKFLVSLRASASNSDANRSRFTACCAAKSKTSSSPKSSASTSLPDILPSAVGVSGSKSSADKAAAPRVPDVLAFTAAC